MIQRSRQCGKTQAQLCAFIELIAVFEAMVKFKREIKRKSK